MRCACFRHSAALLLLGLLAANPAIAEHDPAAIAKRFDDSPRLDFPALDLDALAAEDTITDQISGLPRRFAVARDVALDPQRDGAWSRDDKGRWVWRLAVEAAGAVHLNFGFHDFALPAGAVMSIHAVDADDALGPYTAADRLPHGQLWTPVLAGSRALIEVNLPAGAPPQLAFTLQRIGQGYRGFGHRSAACKSGSCNTDVACLASDDPWNRPRRAVGAYSVGGTDACTGSLVNNTRNDGRMLFATATHCQIDSDNDAAAVLVYWLYESPTCRVPGSPASGTALPKPSSRTTPGLRFLAATNNPFAGNTAPNTRSDFTLLELATPPAGNNFDLYWAGWDRSPPPSACAAPSDPSSTAGLCASIHHPSVDEKRITFVESPLTLGSIASAQGVHWFTQWDPTPPRLPFISPLPDTLVPSVTEPGSSGSPLYNAEQRLIGVLSGGASACGVDLSRLNDEYGGLFHAWEGLGSSTTRMRDWLDPTNSGVMRIDGHDSRALQVSIESSALASPPAAGETIELRAEVSGGDGQYRYEWDIDNDLVADSTAPTLSLSLPSATRQRVVLRVRDGGSGQGSQIRDIDVRGPRLLAEAATAAPSQLCGNNDSNLDPGERWRLPVQLRNDGTAGLDDGHALFAMQAPSGSLDLGPNGFGYAGTGDAAVCGFDFIDIASGGNAVAALALTDPDDGRTSQVISLGGQGVLLYGERRTEAVMSTNGYVSFNSSETGLQWDNFCDGRLVRGALGPQLRPYHDDLVVNAGGGLRYRHFSSCPRPGQVGGEQPCHVFQWSNMGTFADAGSFEFQAIAYENSGQVVYQYRGVDARSGGSTTVGLLGPSGDPLNLSCNADVLRPEGTFCAYTPQARPEVRAAARLVQGAAALPALAPGATATALLPLQIAGDAACGADLGVDFIAAADPRAHSTGFAEVFAGEVAANCQRVTQCETSNPLQARRGLYYNGLHPGTGLNAYFYDLGAGEQFFGGLWYTADTARNPTWYVIAGPTRDFSGELPLVQVRNAGAPSGFNPQETVVGRAWIAQVDDDSLLLAWRFDDGRIGAERMDATPGLGFAAQNHTQAWFAPSEPGWGMAIESLGLGVSGGGSELEFFATYLFDGSGVARWVIGDKPNAASGEVPLFALKVNCPGCVHFADYADSAQPAGSMNIQYSARNSATLNTQIVLPAPLQGSWTREALNIVPIADPVP